jgi:hypothetical protein
MLIWTTNMALTATGFVFPISADRSLIFAEKAPHPGALGGYETTQPQN